MLFSIFLKISFFGGSFRSVYEYRYQYHQNVSDSLVVWLLTARFSFNYELASAFGVMLNVFLLQES